jgi:hypothetical protein
MKNNSKTSGNETNAKYKLVCCLNCLHADLHRYDNNPTLAACHAQPQPDNARFPYQVEVACHLRKCNDWALDPEKKTVEQRSKVA